MIKKFIFRPEGPGAKPSEQEHSNPPSTFLQVPLPQALLCKHSSISTHLAPVGSRPYPLGQIQRYDPSVFIQDPPSHNPLIISHSLKSSPDPPRPIPRGQSLENCVDPGLGHSSHSPPSPDPQALPRVQQQFLWFIRPGRGAKQNSPRYSSKQEPSLWSIQFLRAPSRTHPAGHSQLALPNTTFFNKKTQIFHICLVHIYVLKGVEDVIYSYTFSE